MDEQISSPEIVPKYPVGRVILIGFALICLAVVWYLYDLGIISPPKINGVKMIVVEVGETAEQTGQRLLREGIIRNVGDFLLYLKITGHDTAIKPGIYVFRDPISVPRIVMLIAGNTHEIDITLVEGWTNGEMAEALERVGLFSKEEFLAAAEGKEGYLFPDTYRVFENATPESFVDRMNKRFGEKIAPLTDDIVSSRRPLSDVVVMASLIEKESSGDSDRTLISGILWKRLEKGMPLQADATLSYLTGRASKDLTQSDLKIDSLYNTYRYKGLPKGPIGNPGFKALDAAVHPQVSPYLFYLHDEKGVAHFARTFEEHKKNKIRYLR